MCSITTYPNYKQQETYHTSEPAPSLELSLPVHMNSNIFDNSNPPTEHHHTLAPDPSSLVTLRNRLVFCVLVA